MKTKVFFASFYVETDDEVGFNQHGVCRVKGTIRMLNDSLIENSDNILLYREKILCFSFPVE